MKIFAKDHESWVELKHNKYEDYDSFEFNVLLDLDHSEFNAKNSDVHFIGMSQFIRCMKNIREGKETVARIEGTYNCFIQFEKKEDVITVSFSVGSTLSATMQSDSQDFIFESEFRVNENSFNLIVSDFKELI